MSGASIRPFRLLYKVVAIVAALFARDLVLPASLLVQLRYDGPVLLWCSVVCQVRQEAHKPHIFNNLY